MRNFGLLLIGLGAAIAIVMFGVRFKWWKNPVKTITNSLAPRERQEQTAGKVKTGQQAGKATGNKADKTGTGHAWE